MKNVTREQLVSTAKQLNRILAVNATDAIKFGPKVKEEDLKKGIATLGEEIEATDFEVNPDNPDFIPFDADAVYTFETLGVLIPKKPPVVVKNATGVKVGTVPTEGKTIEELKAEIEALKNQMAGIKKAKSPKKDRYTRSHAIVDAIKTAGTRDQLIALSNKLFLEHNPDVADGKTTARDMLNYVMPTLLLIGRVMFDETTKIFSPVE